MDGEAAPREKRYWVYILRCADGTLYTGITNDVPRRLAAHNSGRGAKYTRGRGPVELVYREACGEKSAALRREAAVKRLSREEKLRLLGGRVPGWGGVCGRKSRPDSCMEDW